MSRMLLHAKWTSPNTEAPVAAGWCLGDWFLAQKHLSRGVCILYERRRPRLLMGAIPDLLLFFNSRFYRLRHESVLGINLGACVLVPALHREQKGPRQRPGGLSGEGWGGTFSCNFQGFDLLPYSRINYSPRSREWRGAGE